MPSNQHLTVQKKPFYITPSVSKKSHRWIWVQVEVGRSCHSWGWRRREILDYLISQYSTGILRQYEYTDLLSLKTRFCFPLSLFPLLSHPSFPRRTYLFFLS